VLNGFDSVIVQHEYGIYGGPDGEEILAVLEALTVPSIVVLHTVLESPTIAQRAVLERIGALATLLVVMSERALAILRAHYDVPLEKVSVIPHGVQEPATPPHHWLSGRRVLTWGLIGPGKGIERGIRAMAGLTDLDPPVEYLVVGKTHPKVAAVSGEEYRESLIRLTRHLGLDDVVSFVDDYLDADQLAEYIDSADVVLLPYDTRDQVTSGVLVEALSSGKPVVSTRFPHAVELLTSGAGIVVDHDPREMAAALRTVLENPGVARSMSEAAKRIGGHMGWRIVAAQYEQLAESIWAVRSR
jgi:glycosyltransferase involved in cell wall biosynthesis